MKGGPMAASTERKQSEALHKLRVGDLVVDLVARRVMRGDQEVELAPKEYELLVFFARNPGRAFSREEIYEQVWDDATKASSRAADVTVARLRRKLNLTDQLRVVRKYGYRLDIPASPPSA